MLSVSKPSRGADFLFSIRMLQSMAVKIFLQLENARHNKILFFYFLMDKICNYAFTVNTKNIYYFYFDFYFKTTPSNKCCFGEPNGRTRCHLPCRLHKQKQPHHTDNLIDTCVNHALGINTKVYEK